MTTVSGGWYCRVDGGCKCCSPWVDTAVSELYFDVTEDEEQAYFWNPSRPFVFLQMTRLVNLVGSGAMVLTTVDGSAKEGIHYLNATTAVTFREGAQYPNEFPPNGNMSITLLPQALEDAANGTYLYFRVNLSHWDNVVGPRAGSVTSILIELSTAAAIPYWPPFKYPALAIIIGCVLFVTLAGCGALYYWYRKQRQPNRWRRRGHTLNSPRMEAGFNPYKHVSRKDRAAAGLLHAQNPPMEWHAYIEDPDEADSSDSDKSEHELGAGQSTVLRQRLERNDNASVASSRQSLATRFSITGQSVRRPSTGQVGRAAWSTADGSPPVAAAEAAAEQSSEHGGAPTSHRSGEDHTARSTFDGDAKAEADGSSHRSGASRGRSSTGRRSSRVLPVGDGDSARGEVE